MLTMLSTVTPQARTRYDGQRKPDAPGQNSREENTGFSFQEALEIAQQRRFLDAREQSQPRSFQQ